MWANGQFRGVAGHSGHEFENRRARDPNPDGCVHHFETENRKGESFAVRKAESGKQPRSPIATVPNQRVCALPSQSQLSAPIADMA